MSRIGNLPIQIPDKVKVELKYNGGVAVEGPKGKLDWTVPSTIKAHVTDMIIHFERETDQKEDKALHGLSRSLVANMVTGVSEGFEKKTLCCWRWLPCRNRPSKLSSFECRLFSPCHFYSSQRSKSDRRSP